MNLPPEEIQFELYFKQLIELEKRGEKTEVRIGPFTAMTLIGLLQLATRHPDMDSTVRKICRDFVRQFEPLFKGTLGEEIIRRGGHPEWDR